MISRFTLGVVLALVVPVSACGPADEMITGEKHVISASELLEDTSGLTNRVKRETYVDFRWNRRMRVEFTTARQGEARVISRIVVRFPSHTRYETYSAKLLDTYMIGSKYAPVQLLSVELKRTHWNGEKGGAIGLRADGNVDFGFYQNL